MFFLFFFQGLFSDRLQNWKVLVILSIDLMTVYALSADTNNLQFVEVRPTLVRVEFDSCESCNHHLGAG